MKSIAVNFSKERLGLVRICAALYAWSTGELSLASRIGLIIPGKNSLGKEERYGSYRFQKTERQLRQDKIKSVLND